MTKKEKRDLRINQEKEYLLDPEYVAAKKKKRKKNKKAQTEETKEKEKTGAHNCN